MINLFFSISSPFHFFFLFLFFFFNDTATTEIYTLSLHDALPISLLSLAQFAVKGTVVLPVAAGHQVGDADVEADHRGIWLSLDGDLFFVGESEPPAIGAPVQGDAAVDAFACQHCTMVACQLDRNTNGLALLQSTDREPVVKGGVGGDFQNGNIGVGLDTGLP